VINFQKFEVFCSQNEDQLKNEVAMSCQHYIRAKTNWKIVLLMSWMSTIFLDLKSIWGCHPWLERTKNRSSISSRTRFDKK